MNITCMGPQQDAHCFCSKFCKQNMTGLVITELFCINELAMLIYIIIDTISKLMLLKGG